MKKFEITVNLNDTIESLKEELECYDPVEEKEDYEYFKDLLKRAEELNHLHYVETLEEYFDLVNKVDSVAEYMHVWNCGTYLSDD